MSSHTEILGFLTGVVNVWLPARQNMWNWLVGLANNAFYVVVFVTAALYGAAGLHGWWTWAHPGACAELSVTRTPRGTWIWLMPPSSPQPSRSLSSCAASRIPPFTTALSLAAIYGQTKKYLESWWIWIVDDLI